VALRQALEAAGAIPAGSGALATSPTAATVACAK